MTNKSKVRGTRWESGVVAFLQEHGYPHAERRALAGAQDKGDVLLPGLMIECKDEQKITLSVYADEVATQTSNCPPGTIGVAWIKRRGKGVDKSYILMDPETFLDLIDD